MSLKGKTIYKPTMQYFFLLLPLMEVFAKTPGSSSFCETGCQCRGELKFTLCAKALFTQIPTTIPPSTELLDLSENELTIIPARSFPAIRKLRVLLLQDNNIRSVADGAFSQLDFLQKLDLSRNNISSLGEGFSLGLGSLRELLLADNQLKSLDGRSLSYLDGLQRLNLTGNNIHSIQMRAFGGMSQLRQLHLQGNRVTTLESGVFSMLRSLEVLNLQVGT